MRRSSNDKGASTTEIQDWVNANAGKVWSSDLSTRDLIELHEQGFAISITIYHDTEGFEGFHQVGLWDVEYNVLGRPSKIVYTDSNFPTQLAKMKLCDFEAIRATPGMRAGVRVNTELPNGSIVRTLEMQELRHPTADVAHYSPD